MVAQIPEVTEHVVGDAYRKRTPKLVWREQPVRPTERCEVSKRRAEVTSPPVLNISATSLPLYEEEPPRQSPCRGNPLGIAAGAANTLGQVA